MKKVYDRKKGCIIEVPSPGIVTGMLRHFPDRYTLDIPKDAQPVYDKKKNEVVYVDKEEKEELIKKEMEYQDVEEVTGGPDLSEMNLTELRAYAKEQGIKGTTRKDRETLIDLLTK